jgi:hypothetical protein
MTDETSRPLDEPQIPTPDDATEPGPGAPPEGGSTPGEATPGTEAKSPEAREWLGQLQTMIDRIAGEAAPVARDVAAKAAELAAVAGEKAGPFARRAAEVTEDVGARMAVRSRQLADELRHRGAESGIPPTGDAQADAAGSATAAPGENRPIDPPAAPDEGPAGG